MERFKKTFSFRKKKDHVPESSKPHQWQEDEQKVRDGTCSFQVRYLGCIEVFESRGIHVCEEAVKALKAQCKGKYQRAILYVSGDALRVVDEISKGLIVDQTIEKVSFCAPDRNHEKGFAYICRDGTTRRWMCHGFLAVKESHGDRKANFGERLSHAVGCAFSICLEKKQKREKDSVTVTYNDKGTSFTRLGSFRQASLTERMMDPQSTIIPEPVPPPPQVRQEPGGGFSNVPMPATAIARPQASADVLQRQMSFRGFQKLAETSPFKRQLSLRLNELPSTLERTGQMQPTQNNNNTHSSGLHSNGPGKVPSIAEVSPTKEQADISDMCAQLSYGLTALTEEDPFSSPAAMLHTQTTTTHSNNTSQVSSNAWSGGKVSDAEFWLQNTATAVSSTPPVDPFVPTPAAMSNARMNGQHPAPPLPAPVIDPFTGLARQSHVAAAAPPFSVAQVHHGTPPPHHPAYRAPHLSSQLRSHSIDSAPPPSKHMHASGGSPWTGTALPEPAKNDPFDAAWHSRTPNRQTTNPFQQQNAPPAEPAFTVNM